MNTEFMVGFSKDGDQWCAFYPETFENLAESPAGFGDTIEEAFCNLVSQEEPPYYTPRPVTKALPVFDIEKARAWIDGSSYEALLSKWRFAPVGDPLFQGDLGDYFSLVMNQKKAALSDGEAVAISKRVGLNESTDGR